MSDVIDIRTFSSRVVDLSNISEESAARIAAMIAGRQQRLQLEAQSPAKSAAAFAALFDDIASEERSNRDILRRTEQKEWEKMSLAIQEARQYTAQSLAAHQSQAAEQKKIHQQQEKIKQRILRESFWNFMKQSADASPVSRGSTSSLPSRSSGQRAAGSPDMRETTAVLSELYRDSVVPFATDPEACWQRGITTPPAQQRPVVVPSPDRRKLHVIPPYYALAETLREGYWTQREERGAPAVLDSLGVRTPEQRSRIEYRRTPFATYAHNFPFSAPPSDD